MIQNRYKALFKALSDDKRIEIIKITSKRPWYNKELADYFNLTTATLSYHLNLLLDLGILNFEPSINNRYYYTTNKENLKKLFDIALKDLLE
nr:ArsR family transcriptional regulator [Tissierella simiarum]